MQKPAAGQFTGSNSPPQGMRTYSRICKNVDSKPAALLPHVSQLYAVYIICSLVQLDYELFLCVLLLLTDSFVCFLSHRERMRPEQTVPSCESRKEEAVHPGVYMQCKLCAASVFIVVHY